MEILKLLELVFSVGEKWLNYSRTRRKLSTCSTALIRCDASLLECRKQKQVALGLAVIVVVAFFVFSRYYTIVPRS